MSISSGKARHDRERAANAFGPWIAAAHKAHGDFTALVVLARIVPPRIVPVASSFLTIVGAAVTWAEIRELLAGARQPWDGACFFPVRDAGGPLDNATARARLRRLEQRLAEDRLVLNEGHFFDTQGRRLLVEEDSDPPAP